MSFRLATFSALTLFGALGRLFGQGPAAALDAAVKGKTSPLDFTMPDLAGKETSLADYKGKVTLLVNVASRCGLTPQYEQLQAIYNKYQGQGFAILGFPANNFLGQEPGNNEEIGAFCKKNYGVSFPIFSKISVKGSNQAPLYRYLTGSDTNPGFDGDIKWNFEKFLVGKNGKIIARFSPKTKPDAPEVLAAIEAALKAN